jgi:hypothetical protein
LSRDRGTTPTGLEDMPPLEEDEPVYGDGPIPVGVHDGFDEMEAMAIEEVDQNLLPKIDAMQMGPTLAKNCADAMGRDWEPIIQFPEDDDNQAGEKEVKPVMINVHPFVGNGMQAMSNGSGSRRGSLGPHSSDIIPPLKNLSTLQVSFGSADVHMTDSILGKRAAEEEEVQGERLELSLGLNFGGANKPASSEMGGSDKLGGKAARQETKAREMKQKIVKTGHTNTGKKARPHVWSHQAQ